MQGEPEQLIQSLSLRYFGVLALVAALLLVDQAVLQPMMIQLNGYGPVINLAGRQRMLSQRMTKDVLAIGYNPEKTDQCITELRLSLASWLEVHEGLQHGNTALQLPGTNVESITAAFADLDPHVQEMASTVRQVCQNASSSDADIKRMLIHEQAFLTGMDEIVGMFEEEAAHKVFRIRTLGFAATLLVLALMVGLAKVVVQPASGFIRQQVHKLSTSEARFRLLVERMNDGLVVFDSDGRAQYVNERFASMMLQTPEELVGKPLQKLLAGPNLRLFLKLLSHVLPSPEVARELQWELPGGQKCVTLTAQGTTEKMEENDGLSFLVVTDITDLKRAEIELLKAKDALEARVVERTQELTKANESLASEVVDRQAAEERNRLLQSELAHATRVTTLGQFATGLAHEINQPLGAISNYADTLNLLLESEKSSKASMVDISKRIQSAALRAGEIIRGMRNFLKLKPAEKSEEYINTLVEDVLDLCSTEIRLHHIKVNCLLNSTKQTRVLVDSIQIQQVLVNLINNAIQAMNERKQPRELTIQTVIRGEDVLVLVEDNGPGFPADLISREISPFQSSKAEGLGMGLSISHALVTAHGGEFWIENVSPNGARIGFSLNVIKQSNTDVEADHICR